MKKVFFAVLFLGAFATANATMFINPKEDECHAQGCEGVADFEEAFELTDDEADGIYDFYYSLCMGE